MKRRASPSPKHSGPRDVFALLELSDLEALDLHGLDRLAATHELDFFLQRAIARRVLGVKIIHGRGERILAQATEQRLRALELPFRGSTLPHEAGAVIYVLLSPEKA